MIPVFPFGSELSKVEQQDKSPKKVFVLGVYASAVHAKWKDADDNVKVNALAVASEPYIFWKGEDADNIIKEIIIRPELGKLIPADRRFNGPSGNVLDDLFLMPLGYTRQDAWLCDLLPYSRLNDNQKEAIETHYNPLIKEYDLPACTIPAFKPADLKNADRVKEIVAELEQSQADTIILLGDAPIRHFLLCFAKWKKLSDFGDSPDDYGKTHNVKIEEKTYKVIPLVHPRQAGKLGSNSEQWYSTHVKWVNRNITMNYGAVELNKMRVNIKPSYCLRCGSDKISSYLYGMPLFSEKLQEDLSSGKIILGGCCKSDDDPGYACIDCKTDFFKVL